MQLYYRNVCRIPIVRNPSLMLYRMTCHAVKNTYSNVRIRRSMSSSIARTRDIDDDNNNNIDDDDEYFTTSATILPKKKIIQTFSISPPPPLIEQPTTTTTNAMKYQNLKVTDQPVILFQSNRLLMIDKPAGWKVFLPSPSFLPPPQQQQQSKYHVPNIIDTSNIQESRAAILKRDMQQHFMKKFNKKYMKNKQKLQRYKMNINKDIDLITSLDTEHHDVVIHDDNDYQMIQQHLQHKQQRSISQKQKHDQELLQQIIQHEKEQEQQQQQHNGIHYPISLERVRNVLTGTDNRTTKINHIDNTSLCDPYDTNDTAIYDIVSYYKKNFKIGGGISHENIYGVHHVDPSTSGLTLLATGPKSRKRAQTIYKQGYKIFYAIIQTPSLSSFASSLNHSKKIQKSIIYNDRNPFTWHFIDGYMIRPLSNYNDMDGNNTIASTTTTTPSLLTPPSKIVYKPNDVQKYELRSKLIEPWYCSLQYRPVQKLRGNQQATLIEIKVKQVAYEMIRALLSAYHIPILGDIRYGAEQSIFPIRSPYHTQTLQHMGIPLHCSCIQLPKHIHLGPPLNSLHRTISAPIPDLWYDYFHWTWDDISAWEYRCLNAGIESW